MIKNLVSASNVSSCYIVVKYVCPATGHSVSEQFRPSLVLKSFRNADAETLDDDCLYNLKMCFACGEDHYLRIANGYNSKTHNCK